MHYPDEMIDGEEQLGIVLAYDLRKGFGFISLAEFSGQRFFVHAADVKPGGEIPESCRELKPGLAVAFTPAITERGRRALEVRPLGEAYCPDGTEDRCIPMGRQRGVVSRFDAKRGFGFLQNAASMNVFFHWQDLPAGMGFRTVEAGAAVEYEIVRGEDGRLRAANVRPL